MASKLNYAAALEKAAMDARIAAIGPGAQLFLFSVSQPTGPASADGVLVAGPFICGTPFAPPATLALPSVITPTLPASVNAAASVQPTWWRVKTAAGVAMLDGSAFTSGAYMTIGPTTTGQPVAVLGWTLKSSNFGH